MTYGQDPMMLAKKGNSWNPSQNEQPLDEGLIAAIAKIMAERGMRSPGYSPGFQEGLGQGAAEDAYAQDAAASRAQFGMMQDGSPNALQGGVVAPNPPQIGLYGTDQWAGMSPRARDDYATNFGAVGDPQSPEWGGLEGYLDSPEGQQGAVRPASAPGPANYGETPAPKAKAKKGEYSDFFKALKAAKSGNKDVKKSFKELASQLEAEGTVSAT